MTTLELQQWLNAHGANLLADGKFGPVTRAAIIDTFRNTSAPAATATDIVGLANRLGCEPRQIRAVASVESAGGGWDNAGLLKCLWERHYLWRRIRIAVPFLSNPTPGGYTIDADHDGICDSWEKLADAAGRFGFATAAECASFGKFQVMGAHWKVLGYPSVIEMVWRLSRDEAAHYEQFARYIEANGLKGALRKVDGNPMNCRPLAEGYNGKKQKGYDGRIATAYRMDRA